MNKKENSVDRHDYLALLPPAILTLVALLSEEDKQVLAYLISRSTITGTTTAGKDKTTAKEDHSGAGYRRSPALFDCDCFGCYTSFWARWDASENRELIDEIVEAYEEGLAKKKKKVKSGKVKKKSKRSCRRVYDDPRVSCGEILDEKERVLEDEEEGREVGSDRGSFRSLLSSVAEKVSAFWRSG